MTSKPIGLLLFIAFAAIKASLASGQAASEATPPCTCGANARTYEAESAVDRAKLRQQRTAEPDWCFEEARALLHDAYGGAPKVPPGFRGNEMTDFERIVRVEWIGRPSTPRIVGAYRMDHTLVHAATLAEAKQEVESAFERDRAADRVIPFLAASRILDQRERRLFFEFLAPSDIGGKAVAFRVWKSEFFVPSVGSLLADADRTGSMTVGVMPRTTGALELSLFLETFWWDAKANVHGAQVLALPKVQEGPRELYVTMPTRSVSGGDWGIDDRVIRYQWRVRLDRRSGEVTRTIEPDILCIGKHNPAPRIDP